MTSQTTRQIITPILKLAYGEGGMVDSLATHLAWKIDAGDFDSRGREHMVMRVCWDWMTGGSTAEAVARKIEGTLP